MSNETSELATTRLKNEIDRLTIERDRYHAALNDARVRLWGLWTKARQDTSETVTLTVEEITVIAKIVDKGWRFRQHGCPRCGMPCEYFFAMAMIGPDIRLWDCPKCGGIGDVKAASSLKTFAKEAKAADDLRKSQSSGESDE